jgi:hypothetical protein
MRSMHSQTPKQPLQRWTVPNKRLKTTGKHKTQAEKKTWQTSASKNTAIVKKKKKKTNFKQLKPRKIREPRHKNNQTNADARQCKSSS